MFVGILSNTFEKLLPRARNAKVYQRYDGKLYNKMGWFQHMSIGRQ